MEERDPRESALGAARCGAAALAAVLALALGCGPSEPLERIRLLQDVSGDHKGAIEPLRELLEERPDDPEVHYRYGIALLATGQPGLAMWPLKRAMESPEWVERAGLPLAGALISASAFEDAVAVCDQVLEQSPDHVGALLQRANARMHSRRDYEAALADADRVLELDPDNREALVPRAVALLALERVEEAAVLLEELDRLYADESLGLRGSAGFCTARASFAKEKGDLELAAERYDGCLESFPADGTLVGAAIAFFDETGRPERSVEILEKAVEALPEDASYRLGLALRLRGRGELDAAEALLRAGTEVGAAAQKAEAWAAVGSFNLETGDLDEAVAAFAKARSIDPTRSPQLALGYADALIVAERYDEALALSEEMVVPAHRAMIRGRVALAQRRPADALEAFEEGLRLWPNNAVGRYYAAAAAEQIGDFERAVEDYRYAMRIDAQATDAYLRLARLQVAAGRDDLALSALSFKPGGRPNEVEAVLLQIEILARKGRAKRAPRSLLQRVAQAERWPAALAALGRGVRARSGPAAAVEVVRSSEHLDLEDPAFAEVLEVVIEDLAASEKPAEGVALVEAGLAKHPEAAAFHALHGRALALAGAVPAARAAYERALEIEPGDARALLGLARLEAAAGAPEAALAHYEQLLAADANSREAARGAAEVLTNLKRPADAESKLEALLAEYPWDAAAARALAELRLARGVRDERTVELARRAVRFGGGAEAKALLDRARGGAGGSDAAPGAETG